MNERKKIFYRQDYAKKLLDIADQDYISARTCFINGLPIQFLLLSQQAIEKYLKTSLLINNERVLKPEKRYFWIKIFSLCNRKYFFQRRLPYKRQKYTHDIIELKKYLAGKFPIKFKQGVSDFLEKINYINNFRYGLGGFNLKTTDLFILDETVLFLRSLCREIKRNHKKENIMSLFRNGELIKDGFIEKIIKDKDNHKNLYEKLVWNNKNLLNRNKASSKFKISFITKSSIFTGNDIASKEYYESLKDYIFIPQDALIFFDKGGDKPKWMLTDSDVTKEIFEYLDTK